MSMQYTGSVTLDGTVIPVTSANLASQPNPIVPPLVWGGGWHVNYGQGQLKNGGSISFPLFNSITSLVKSHSIVMGNPQTDSGGRDAYFTVIQDNGGIVQTFTSCKVASFSLSINALAGEPVTCSVGIAAISQTSAVSTSTPITNPPIPQNTNDTTPLMSYNAVIAVTGVAANSVVSLELTANNNQFILFTADGSRNATAIQQGQLNCEGTMTLYPPSTTSLNGASIAVTIGAVTFNVPNIVVKSVNNDLSGPNNKPMEVVSFECLGTTLPPIY